jgi:predicted site-specific integrase-resolvase
MCGGLGIGYSTLAKWVREGRIGVIGVAGLLSVDG